ncbi:hypothetical protein IAT38_004164 [Cryptococcus sp. DSM 104549]
MGPRVLLFGEPLRSLTTRQIVQKLKEGPGATIINSDVSSIAIRYVAKNSAPGPAQFLRNYAPRIAYANPNLPIHIHRIPDPRSGLNILGLGEHIPLEKKEEALEKAKKEWEKGQPQPTMEIAFRNGPVQTLPLAHLNGKRIFAQLISVAGEERPEGIEAPLLQIEEGEGEAAAESGAEGQGEKEKVRL